MRQIDHEALYPQMEPVERVSAYVQLRPAEKAFVEAYLSTLGSSAAAAGKSIVDMIPLNRLADPDKTPGRAAAMLQRPMVQAAIAERAREISAKFEVTTNSVMKEVAAVAFANMGNYLHITENGDPYIDLSNCNYEQLAAISEVTVEDFTEGRGDNARDVRRVKLKLHSKMDALDKLMKFFSLYAPEKIDVNVNATVKNVNVNMTVEQLAEMYASKLRGQQ
jgi:phage terminase small subunit